MFYVIFCTVTFSLCIAGIQTQSWSMTAIGEVHGKKGQSVVLPCTFTHPRQRSFTGNIWTRWITDHKDGRAVFLCIVSNHTQVVQNNCSAPERAGRFSLAGDPRQKNLSLLIQDLQLTDNNIYYCRVELGNGDNFQRFPPTTLNISAPPQILSLTQGEGEPPYNQSLQCVVEGNPLPTVTWWSAGKQLDHTHQDSKSYKVISQIETTSEKSYTCKASNSHGVIEKTLHLHAGPHTLALALGLSFALVLLLGSLALIWLKHRDKSPTALEVGSEVVYADIDISVIKQGYRSPAQERMENDVNYAALVLK